MSQQVDPGDWRTFGTGTISVDVVDRDDHYEVTADLPGYERDDVELTLADGTLRIAAERADESTTEGSDDEEAQYVRRERRRTAVSRSIDLPQPIDEDDASASHKNGVLTVELPKVDPGTSGRTIDIE